MAYGRGDYPEGPPARGGGRNPGTRTGISIGTYDPPDYGPTGPPPRTKVKPKPKPKPQPRTTPPANPNQWLDDLLDSIYGGQENALLGEITRTRESAARTAAAHQKLMAEYAKWYTQNIPSQINSIYGSAAGTQSYIAKGFADGMQIAQDQAAAEANKIIGLSGAPAAANITPGTDAANVLYGTGGYLPGNTLSSQGAAFAGAAALQGPAIIAEGSKNAAKIIATAEETISKLESELADLETKRGETGLKISEARRAEDLKIQIENRKHSLALRKQKFNEARDTAKFNFDLTQTDIKNKLAQDKHDLAVWKAENPNLQVFGSAKGGYFAFDPRTGKTSKNPIVAGTGEPIKIFGSGSAGYWGYDANTGSIFQMRPPTKKGKPASQKTINDGWKMIRAGKKGHWALQADPDSPLSTAELNDIKEKLQDGSIPGVNMTWAEFMKLKEKDRFALEDELGIQFTSGSPFPIYQALIESGIGAQRAFKMIKKYFPDFANRVTLKIPWVNVEFSAGAGPPGKGNAVLSGGSKLAWLASLWVQAGGDPAVASTAAAIAMAESGGRVDAWNPRGLDKSAGLWQINYHGALRKPRTRQFGPPELLRKDPLANARAAVAIYNSAGGFSPWTTYTSGAYKKHLGAREVSFNEGGAWGGSLSVADQYKSIATHFGLSASGKRTTKRTASGGVSDHWTGSKNAFAYDLSGTVARMDQAAMALARALGINWDGKSELIEDVYIGPFRIQIIYNTPKYGGHEDHIHLGVRRVGSGGAV